MLIKTVLVFLGGVYVGQEVREFPRVYTLFNKVSKDMTNYLSTPEEPEEAKKETPIDTQSQNNPINWWIWGGRK